MCILSIDEILFGLEIAKSLLEQLKYVGFDQINTYSTIIVQIENWTNIYKNTPLEFIDKNEFYSTVATLTMLIGSLTIQLEIFLKTTQG